MPLQFMSIMWSIILYSFLVYSGYTLLCSPFEFWDRPENMLKTPRKGLQHHWKIIYKDMSMQTPVQLNLNALF